jgi:alpha-L-fucosidase 2
MAIIWPLFRVVTIWLACLIVHWQVDAKALWSKKPVGAGGTLRNAFPVGNGRLGGKSKKWLRETSLNSLAMSFGQPGSEKINMNIDSLWSGGPFESNVRIDLRNR